MNWKIVLTLAVIIFLIAGLYYFNSFLTKASDNPYEYSIDSGDQNSINKQLYKEIKQILLPFAKAHALSVGPGSRLYVSGDKTVMCLKDLKEKIFNTVLDEPAGALAVSKEGNLYTGLSDRVIVLNQNGAVMDEWSSLGEKAVITEVAVSEDNVFIADAGNKFIWHFDVSGRLIGKMDGKNNPKNSHGFIVPSPYFDVAIGENNTVWITNPGKHSVEQYSFSGEYLSSWEKPYDASGGFKGCCNPTDITILQGNYMITSEKGLVHVKLFTLQGDFMGLIADEDTFGEGAAGLDLDTDSEGRIYILDPEKSIVHLFEKEK
jgi:hypothetical protein